MRRKSILIPLTKPQQKTKTAPSLLNKNASSNSNKVAPPAKSNFSARPARKSLGSYGTRGTIALEQTITIVQKIALRQEAPFAESCLPKTMKIALDSREFVLPLLRSYPNSWSFIDKVFVMLAPIFREDIAKHYAKDGQSMVEIYHCLQIECFDKLISQLLLEKIEAIKLQNKDVYKSRRV